MILKTALIGDPVDHSVSDIMFQKLFEYSNLNCFYKHEKIRVQKEFLEKDLERLKAIKYLGFNVTSPHKLNIMNYINEYDKTAEIAKSVNTVKIVDNIFRGYNTDWYGVYYSILKYSGIGDYNVCILGTGGASRAAIMAAKKVTTGKITVVYRSYPRISKATKQLIKENDCTQLEFIEYTNIKECLEKANVIINATTVGMLNTSNCFPFSYTELDRLSLNNKIIMDFVYNPVDTEFCRYFNKGNNKVVDGLWMMIYQGVEALSIWLDEQIQLSEVQLQKIHDELEECLNACNLCNEF